VFKWTGASQQTFDRMTKVMSTCLVLLLPYFSHPFILECDTSWEGIGVVLMQNMHPIYFERKKIRGHALLYTIHDKEILSIMHALSKFRQYLVGTKFIVKIDHNSLKYFLEKKYLNQRKQKWIRKIQAYGFDI